MVTPVNSTSPATRTSIFYLNDIHGNIDKMEKVKSAINQFDVQKKQHPEIDALKLCSGDTLIGLNDKKNQTAVDFLNAVKFDAITLGNHEMDNPIKKATQFYRKITSPIITTNLIVPDGHELQKEVVSSVVKDINGTKYGIVGIQPLDFSTRATSMDWFAEGVKVLDKEKTIKKIQEEVDKLEKKGIDKIVLLSHSGYAAEKEIAQKTEGIDVIIGGHSHDLVFGIKDGENLLYSKRNEPVILTQAYKDGKYFGVLNVGFDDKGRIVDAQNNVTPTKTYSSDLLMTYFTNQNMGAPKVIGRVLNKYSLKTNGMLEENPYPNLITDAMKTQLKTDIAILNAANIRGQLPVGEVTDRDITELTPFNNKILIIRINQKELVDAIKLSGKSFDKPDMKPGIMQLSGVTYKMNKKGELLEANFINKNGEKVPIDINNPDENITYTTAIDDYYGSGRENFSMLNKIDKALAIYDFDKDKLAIDYVKERKKPLEFKPDGRLIIV